MDGDALPFEISVIVTQKNGLPAIELRKLTTHPDVVKQIVSATLRGQTIILKPRFRDDFRGISSLVEKGILYKNPSDGQYYFTF